VSSTSGHKPATSLSHHAASRAALEHLARCWALELAPRHVRVNAVAAGPTDSEALTAIMGLSPAEAAAVDAEEPERIPLERCGHPTGLATWIVALADPASHRITGQALAVDAGLGPA
jgi:NAD(P)-dependent dehydrogenase (short-subunit alcohol dehydrogenase family)